LVCLLLLGWSARPAFGRTPADDPQPAEPETPYLRATGPLALRFQPAPVAREITAKPAASGPPFPMPEANAEKAPVAAEPPAKPTSVEPDVILPAKPEPKPGPEPIIPDDLRPRVQAEDFLPFFQFPSAAEPALVLPATPPHRATPSTATYRQQ
jgi:hypothetical protein